MKEMTLEAKRENLHQVFDFVTGELKETISDKKIIRQVKLCVEEIFLNISSYAYKPDTGPAKITVEVEGDDGPVKIVISFSDKGHPFDPLSVDDPDTESDLDERKVGGLGIFLVKTTMDGVNYEYKDGQNILTVEKTYPVVQGK